jgi:hypothetical protein
MQDLDWSVWVSRELDRSEPFAREVEGLRTLANASHPRTTGPLAQYTWDQLGELEPESTGRRVGPTRSWADPEKGGGYGYDHVRAYMQAARRVARRFIGSDVRASNLHAHVRGEPLLLPTAAHPAPAQPSRFAAFLTGASWPLGGATAMRQAWRHHRPSTWPDETPPRSARGEPPFEFHR